MGCHFLDIFVSPSSDLRTNSYPFRCGASEDAAAIALDPEPATWKKEGGE
jgi:hypothetical protein